MAPPLGELKGNGVVRVSFGLSVNNFGQWPKPVDIHTSLPYLLVALTESVTQVQPTPLPTAVAAMQRGNSNTNVGIIVIEDKAPVNFQVQQSDMGSVGILTSAMVFFKATCPAAEDKMGNQACHELSRMVE